MNKGLLKQDDADAFEENYKDAKAYHKRANQFLDEGQPVSVIFNVASVALERYLIALCNLYGFQPGNHNYGALMDTAEIMVEFPEELNKEIRSLDSIFNICSLEDYHYENPKTSDADRVLSMCIEVHKLFDEKRIKSLREVFKI